jgi:hypothetical protein
VSLNALTHGISSTRLVVSGERSTDWDTYRREVVDPGPQSARGHAGASWKTGRCPSGDVTLVDSCRPLLDGDHPGPVRLGAEETRSPAGRAQGLSRRGRRAGLGVMTAAQVHSALLPRSAVSR